MFNDPRTIEEIKKNILLLQEQTEALKKETEAIKKEGESKHNKNLLEIDVLRKEREKVENAINFRWLRIFNWHECRRVIYKFNRKNNGN